MEEEYKEREKVNSFLSVIYYFSLQNLTKVGLVKVWGNYNTMVVDVLNKVRID